MADFTPQEIEQFLQQFFDTVGARQYVGARYVPIFGRAGEDPVEWDDGAPYEPLTVVMHLGVSYVSRRYVPAGIQVTDTAYWLQTYRYNAQVEQYRQEVLGFQDDIDDRVPFPDSDTYPKYGTEGQVLTTLGDGTTRWDDPVTVTADIAGPLISDWLDEHPEATTTVQNNSVSDAKLTQASGVLPSLKSLTGHLIMGADRYVDVNTTNNTITIPQGTLLFCASATRYYAPVSVAPDAALTIDISYTAIDTSAIAVCYDLDNSQFVLRAYTYAGLTGLVYVFAVRRAYSNYPYALTADFPWSINGHPYGFSIANNSINDNMLTQASGVLPSLKTITAHLILGMGRYANLDTTNNTLTFPQDTLLFCVSATQYYGSLTIAPDGPVSVDISSQAQDSSGIVVCYDLANSQFVTRSFRFPMVAGYVYVCSVRRRFGERPYSVTADFPWSIDGNPYGIEPSGDEVNYMPYIAGSNGTGVKSVSHRGWHEAPENTMPAFRDTMRHNYQYVETDVRMTSDGTYVLLHDPTINRTARNADGTTISSTINIADITYQQAMAYDFGIYKGSQYAGTKIPTLEEFMTFCHKVGLHPYLELKVSSMTAAQISDIVDIVESCGMRGHVTYVSYFERLLAAVTQATPSARLGLFCNSVTAQIIATAQTLKTADNEVFVDSESFTSSEAALCQAAGLPMEVATIDYANILATVPPYVTGVLTNMLNVTELLYASAMGA